MGTLSFKHCTRFFLRFTFKAMILLLTMRTIHCLTRFVSAFLHFTLSSQWSIHVFLKCLRDIFPVILSLTIFLLRPRCTSPFIITSGPGIPYKLRNSLTWFSPFIIFHSQSTL